jgi:hypothetical protein
MVSDPVHYAAEPYADESRGAPAGWRFVPGWYFWTETWADRCGPYSTEAEARAQLARYVREVLGDA